MTSQPRVALSLTSVLSLSLQVEAMLAAINEDVDADRLAELLYILDVNLAWRMHMVWCLLLAPTICCCPADM